MKLYGIVILLAVTINLAACKNADDYRNEASAKGSTNSADAPLDYKNPAHHFSIKYPSGCKEVVESQTSFNNNFGKTLYSQYRSLWGQKGIFEVKAIDFPPAIEKALNFPQNQPNVLDALTKDYTQTWKNCAITEQRNTTWNGFPAKSLRFTLQDDDGGAGTGMALIILANKKAYELSYVGTKLVEQNFYFFTEQLKLDDSAATPATAK